MEREKYHQCEIQSRGYGRNEAITLLRERLGTYSYVKLKKDLNALRASSNESLANQVNKILTRRDAKITPEIITAICEINPRQAPENFISRDELQKNVFGGSWDGLNKALKDFLRRQGYPPEVLTDINTWKQYPELARLFVHARSQGNGYTSVFFSPKVTGQLGEIRNDLPRRSDRFPIYPPSTKTTPPPVDLHPVIPFNPKPIPPSPEPVRPEHDKEAWHKNQIAQLRKRIRKIFRQLHGEDKSEMRRIHHALTPETSPIDAQHFALKIREIEKRYTNKDR